MSEQQLSCDIHARYSRGCSECHRTEMDAFRTAVESALPESWYEGEPVERRLELLVEQWRKLHEVNSLNESFKARVADALAELRAQVLDVNALEYVEWAAREARIDEKFDDTTAALLGSGTEGQ